MKSFLGGSPVKGTRKWQDVFDEYYNDDGNVILFTRETFISDRDGDIPVFPYKYVIKIMDTNAFGLDNNRIYIQLYMVVIPENADQIQEIEEAGVSFGYETVAYADDQLPDKWYDYFYNPLDNKEVVEYLNVAATVLICIDRMRGFYLDQSFNMIGTTGWDMLRSITIGEDWIKASLKRINLAENTNDKIKNACETV